MKHGNRANIQEQALVPYVFRTVHKRVLIYEKSVVSSSFGDLMKMYLDGMLLGIPAIFLIGPVFLLLLQVSVEYGFRSGFAVALGITVSDVICVALAYLGLGTLIQKPIYQTWIGIAGGGIIISFGLGMLLSQPKAKQPTLHLNKRHFLGLFIKGFLVNGINPFVFAYWIGALGIMANSYTLTYWNVTIFFFGAFTVIFSTDVLKAALAEKLKAQLQPSALLRFNRFAGVGLIVLGCVLIGRVW